MAHPARRHSTRKVRLQDLSTLAIEQRIGRLIRHYLRSRSPAIALSVVPQRCSRQPVRSVFT